MFKVVIALCLVLLLVERCDSFRVFPTSFTSRSSVSSLATAQIKKQLASYPLRMLTTEDGVQQESTMVQETVSGEPVAPPAPAVETPRHAIFVGNIPFSVSEDAFTDEILSRLNSHPDFLNIKMVKDKQTGASRGFAYINFKSDERIQDAITALTALAFEGYPSKVDIAGVKTNEVRTKDPMNKRPLEDPEAKARRELETRKRTIFIGNLEPSMSDLLLKDIIATQLGDITNFMRRVKVIVDYDTGRCRGFGYVELHREEDVDTVLNKLAGMTHNGQELRSDRAVIQNTSERKVRTAPAPPQPRQRAEHSVYLGNLDFEVTETLLEEMLVDILGHSNFTNLRVIREKTPVARSRGFAYVDFNTEADMLNAVSELSGIELLGRVMRVNDAKLKFGA